MKSLAKLLLAADLVIIALYFLHLGLGDWPRLINLDGEQNLGAWWGGGKLLLAAAAVASVPLFSPARRVASTSLYWASAISLTYFSADEILALHERISRVNRSRDLGLLTFPGETGAWVFIYALLFLVFCAAFSRQILNAAKADPRSSTLFLGGLATWILGGVVAEVMGYYGLLGGMGSPSQVVIEESLELVGVSLMTLGCVRHALQALRARP